MTFYDMELAVNNCFHFYVANTVYQQAQQHHWSLTYRKILHKEQIYTVHSRHTCSKSGCYHQQRVVILNLQKHFIIISSYLTFGLSTPMPKLIVATMTAICPSVHADCVSARTLADRAA